jgi:hypothetical protein
VFAGLVEVRHELVSLTSLQLRKQLLDCLLHLDEFLDERRAVHHRDISRAGQRKRLIRWDRL